MTSYADQRRAMVREQLSQRGIRDPHVSSPHSPASQGIATSQRPCAPTRMPITRWPSARTKPSLSLM